MGKGIERSLGAMPPLIRITAESMKSHFAIIPDRRVQARCDHELLDVLVISVCAVICGADCFTAIAEWAEYRAAWFRQYLPLKGGIPSHDTFARVFTLIPAEAFEEAFLSWVTEVFKKGGKNAPSTRVCIDGKSVRGTDKGGLGRKKHPLHLISVYAADLRLGLLQSRAKNGSGGETAAALECIKYLGKKHLKGALVSVDAGMANRRVTRAVRQSEADYLVTIKRNQRFTLREMEEKFLTAPKRLKTSTYTGEERNRGRIEKRRCEVMDVKRCGVSRILEAQWKDVRTLVKMVRTRRMKDRRFVLQTTGPDGKQSYERNAKKYRTQTETVYALSSRRLSARQAMEAVREHWGVENGYHWALDVIFSEDDWRVREMTAARNLSMVRRIAYNLLRAAPGKGGLSAKKRRAAWDPEYLAQLIFSLT